MNGDWYYVDGEKQVGPVVLQALLDRARSGFLAEDDLVWKQGWADWKEVREVPEVAAARSNVVPLNPFQSPSTSDYASPTESFAGYGGFWNRLAAATIDCMVVVVIQLPLTALLGLLLVVLGESRETLGDLFLTAGLLGGWLYAALLESGPQQATLGKQVLHLQVTDSHGARIGFGKASVRHFAKIASYLTLGIGFLLAGLTPRKQALHDMMAGCLVVKRPH